MKKLVSLVLGSALLLGCAAQDVVWNSSDQLDVAEATVVLESNLWLDKMPTVGDDTKDTLHGALYLKSNAVLPAELDVETVTLKQGDQLWQLTPDQFDLRTQDEHHWEVAFSQPFDVGSEEPIDVAVALTYQGMVKWLVQNQVTVDKVY